ncbi:MAG: dCTP deaminase [Armatimonadetes bacterium]|nr:dCTP deaminase [Armatimonadota bacterium]
MTTGLQPDRWIREMAMRERMIEPFEERLVRAGVLSYGVSSYGYDMRLADEFLVFTNVWGAVVDPKKLDAAAYIRHVGETCLIPPNSFVLGRSVERFRMPRDVTGVVIGKSTYARAGILVNVTPLEAGWEGTVTIEVSNLTPLPARVYAGEGIAQVLFFQGAEPPETSYGDRGGIYQKQTGITLPRVADGSRGAAARKRPAARNTPPGRSKKRR